MNPDTPNYYMPYDSGEDTDGSGLSDNESEDYDSDDLPDFEDPRIRREEDPRYAIIRAAGPNFNTSELQLKYMEHAPGSHYDNSTNITNLTNFVYLNPPKTTKTSLFSIKSSNRDKNVWVTPFNFQIKTPKVYKNVTKFQLVQISFPNNTQNFINSPNFSDKLIEILLREGVPEDCLQYCTLTSGTTVTSASIAVSEQGRLNSSGQPMTTPISIPTGFYDNQQLANALTKSANNTPPFNIISYDVFKSEFQAHRDISILFNEPGESFQTNVTKTSKNINSKYDIMNIYYSQLHLDSFPEITDKIAFNAYYFPILKELIASNVAEPFINLGGYHFSAIKTFVLGQFLGLNSDIYYNLCQLNKEGLDEFRKLFTFELRHINRYIFTYNPNTRQFGCLHDSLHTSLKNDINNKYNSHFNNALTVNGFNNRTFQTLKTQYSNTNTIFKDMEAYLSTQLANTLTVSNYKYTGGITHSTLHAVTDLNANTTFSSIFVNNTQTFGKTSYGNYFGTQFTFTNFLSYHSTISSYYNTVQSAKNSISSVYGITNYNHHMYVSTKYTGIIPHHIINNKSYQDCKGIPAAFLTNKYIHTPGEPIYNKYLAFESLSVVPPSVLTSNNTPDNCKSTCIQVLEKLVTGYYSCLPVYTLINALPYRLGIDSLNTNNFNFISSIFQVTSTTNFNLFMQINEFQNFNNIDVAMKENYDVSNETTGQVSLMAAKILLQGVGTGEVSETAIQNPVLFETPLGKLDKLEFKIYQDDEPLTPLWLYLPFDLGFNEWDATFQIDEEIGFADRNAGFSGNIPTVPIPHNPSAIQYLALTSSANTLNK